MNTRCGGMKWKKNKKLLWDGDSTRSLIIFLQQRPRKCFIPYRCDRDRCFVNMTDTAVFFFVGRDAGDFIFSFYLTVISNERFYSYLEHYRISCLMSASILNSLVLLNVLKQ